MLQRKQSLFLALAALLLLSTFLFPIATYEVKGDAYTLQLTGLKDDGGASVEDAQMPFHLVVPVLAAAFGVSVFLYRNRPRQMRVVRGASLLMMAVIAFMFITDNSAQAYLAKQGPVESSYGLSFIIPLAVLVLGFLAVRSIKADEELVRSADRLR